MENARARSATLGPATTGDFEALVDTCHSNNSCLVNDAADANIVAFSATDGDTEAQKTSALGHGVQYALTQGLSGEADFQKGRDCEHFGGLGDYVFDEVKRRTDPENLVRSLRPSMMPL